MKLTKIVALTACALVSPFASAAGCPETNSNQGGFLGTVAAPTAGFPVGLESDGSGNLYLSGISPSEVVLMRPNGTVISSFFPANTVNAIGVTFHSGLGIYLTDTGNQDVDLYDIAGNYVSSFSVSAQTTFPEGLTINPVNQEILVVDGSGGNKVSSYTTAGNFVQNFPIAGSSQDGVAYDPTRDTFWVYSSGDDLVRQYDMNFTELRSFRGPSCYNGLAAGEGVAVYKNTLYVVSAGSGVIASFDISGVPMKFDVLEYINNQDEEDGTVVFISKSKKSGSIGFEFLAVLLGFGAMARFRKKGRSA